MTWREAFARLRQDYLATFEAHRDNGGKLATVATVRFLAVFLMRISQVAGALHPILGYGLKQINHLLTGADIAWQANIGGGFQLFHPTGVVIGPKVRIGQNCSLQQGVTLGDATSSRRGNTGSPVIGDRVACGPGVCIVGMLSVGDDVTIAPNAVVTRSVPAGVVAKGVPARW